MTGARLNNKTKNISYHFLQDVLRGSYDPALVQLSLKKILRRFSESSRALIASYFPNYIDKIQIGRTSLRPIEIAGRRAPSYRKDDTRLHVDAFPANPNQGRRILRVFYNYNPQGQARIWRVGEPFEKVAGQFISKMKKPFIGHGWLLNMLGITQGPRTLYDHYMLSLHDNMKFDMNYQNQAASEIIELPALSTWVVYTDCVSHAALRGQHALEQTFYLPVSAMHNPELSPLRVLEKMIKKKLV